MIPSLFIAHGAPLLAVENNEYTQFLNQLGTSLPRPQAVVIFSAHWEASPQKVSEVEQYETIYDFGGFPEALYQIKYPAAGLPSLAREIENIFASHNIPFAVESKRGLDHGSWVVLRLLYPNAEIPIVSMSVNPHLEPEQQYAIGKALATLRAKDVLVIGSGGTVHNLRALNWNTDKVDDWAAGFDAWIAEKLATWDVNALFQYEASAPNAQLAVPPYGKEHFVPLFYAMGAADDVKRATLLHRSYEYGNLSRSVWQFG